ncbi:hypothetical protein [Variovorax sp. MHTC-1]|nr:hypothetical protein [Variovorax sp. MHTC-1]
MIYRSLSMLAPAQKAVGMGDSLFLSRLIDKEANFTQIVLLAGQSTPCKI